MGKNKIDLSCNANSAKQRSAVALYWKVKSPLVGSQVLKAVSTKMVVFWVVAPCRLV
jgi:hypothetical protein